jgi:hypothetical protein
MMVSKSIASSSHWSYIILIPPGEVNTRFEE